MSDSELLETATTVRQGVTRLSRRLRTERPDPGEPLQRLGVLADLQRCGPLSPGEISRRERVQPQSLTRTLASLEQDGLVSREPHPLDGRRSVLALTAAGRQVLARDMHQRDAWLALALAEHLTPTEQRLLRLASEVMERLADVGDVSALRKGA